MKDTLPPEETKLGLPRLGCGLAGGDWNIVKEMIDEIFEGWDVTVYSL